MYCERQNLNLVYGKINIDQWADLDNSKDSDTIAERVDFSIQIACAYIDARLKSSAYSFPITDENVPTVIMYAAALKAGMILYDGRRVASDETEDQVSAQSMEFEQILKRILANTLALPLARISTRPIKVYPRVEEETSRNSNG